MRLRHLLSLALLALIAMNANAQTYTTANLVDAGWKKITTISQAEIGSNFYLFLSE